MRSHAVTAMLVEDPVDMICTEMIGYINFTGDLILLFDTSGNSKRRQPQNLLIRTWMMMCMTSTIWSSPWSPRLFKCVANRTHRCATQIPSARPRRAHIRSGSTGQYNHQCFKVSDGETEGGEGLLQHKRPHLHSEHSEDVHAGARYPNVCLPLKITF